MIDYMYGGGGMEDDGDGDGPVRRFRGPASLKFLDTLQPGQKFQVQSRLNSPAGGQNSRYMCTYISRLAKDGYTLPLPVPHWSCMPLQFIQNAMSEIKKVFDYPPDKLDDWIKTTLHDRWRKHKQLVKNQGFHKYATQEECLAHRPKSVVESQWRELLEYWQSPITSAKCAGCKANRSKRKAQQSTGARPHGKDAAELAAKRTRAPIAKEIYDAINKKRKQMEGLENKPCQHSSKCSTKKMKMSAEASGSRGKKVVSKNKPVRRSERLNKPEHLPLSRSNSVPASPVPLLQECVTEDGEDNKHSKLDESLEGFGSVEEPVEAARMASSASSGEPIEAVKATSYTEPVEAARTTYSDEPVEAVKTTSSVELVDGARSTSSASFTEPVEAARPTAPSSSAEHVQAARLTSISSPKDTSTRVSGGESDEELEFVDNFHIPKGYIVLCKETIKAEPDESLEGFESVGKPVEAARMTSSAFSAEPVEAVKTTTSAESVEAAKTASSAKCPTVDSKLVSTSSPKHISAPFVRSTSVSVLGRDEEFVSVDNFKIPKEYAVLYKKIFDKYGHMATKKVIKSNDSILVACVSSLLEMISTMEITRGADLSESLLQKWEGDIEDVENLGFNVKWLREKFYEVKNNWKSSSGIHKEVEIHEKELDATQVKYESFGKKR